MNNASDSNSLETRFHAAKKNMDEKQKAMYDEFPAFYEKCLIASLNLGDQPMRIRKSTNSSGGGTYVTGPIVSAKPAYYRRLRSSVEMVFEAQLETTHPANGSKHLHTVFIKRLPKK